MRIVWASLLESCVVRVFQFQGNSGGCDRNPGGAGHGESGCTCGGVVVTGAQVRAWSGVELSDEELGRVVGAVPCSSVPDAVAEVVFAVAPRWELR